MGFEAAEATGLGFVCFVVINTSVLSANGVDFGLFFCFISNLPPPPQIAVGGKSYNAYCDMSEGGGWTLVANYWHKAGVAMLVE